MAYWEFYCVVAGWLTANGSGKAFDPPSRDDYYRMTGRTPPPEPRKPNGRLDGH